MHVHAAQLGGKTQAVEGTRLRIPFRRRDTSPRVHGIGVGTVVVNTAIFDELDPNTLGLAALSARDPAFDNLTGLRVAFFDLALWSGLPRWNIQPVPFTRLLGGVALRVDN